MKKNFLKLWFHQYPIKILFHSRIMIEFPIDILLYITFFLDDLKSILALCTLNQESYLKCSSNLLWKTILLERFPESKHFITKDYKNAFVEASKFISLNKKSDFLISILGFEAVGKTSLAQQLTKNSFGLFSVSDYDPTLNSFIHSTSFSVEKDRYNITFLDCAHQTGEFEDVLMEHFLSSPPDCFILVFSVDNKTSFRYIEKVDKVIKKTFNTEWYPGILVANKIDRVRKIQSDESRIWAKDRNLLYAETDSSKGSSSENVMKDVVKYVEKHGSFQHPIHEVWKKIENGEKMKPKESLNDDNYEHWLCNKKYLSVVITKVILGLLCMELRFLHYCIERINDTVHTNVKMFHKN